MKKREREVYKPRPPLPTQWNYKPRSFASAKTIYSELRRRKNIGPLPRYGSILVEITTAYLKKRESVAPPLPKASKFLI